MSNRLPLWCGGLALLATTARAQTIVTTPDTACYRYGTKQVDSMTLRYRPSTHLNAVQQRAIGRMDALLVAKCVTVSIQQPPAPSATISLTSDRDTVFPNGSGLPHTALLRVVVRDSAGAVVSDSAVFSTTDTTAVKYFWDRNLRAEVVFNPDTSRCCNTRIVVTARYTVAGVTLSASVSLVIVPKVAPTSPPPTGSAAPAQLPQRYVDTTWPTLSGRVLAVHAGQSLQAAIDSSTCGDEIRLDASTTYVGPFRLRLKGCAGWIVIRGPGVCTAGVRARPSTSTAFPVLDTNDPSSGVIVTDPGARYWRLSCLTTTFTTFAPCPAVYTAIVRLGQQNQDSLTIPHHIILDHVVTPDKPTLCVQRDYLVSANWVAVVDSWCDGIHAKGYDSQCFVSWNGTGPLAWKNNYTTGAGEGIMIGGANPAQPDWCPQDVEIVGNDITIPASWKGQGFTIKTRLELKCGVRVLIEGNVIHRNWNESQNGYAMVVKVSGDALIPGIDTRDVTIRWNRISEVGAGIALKGAEGSTNNRLTRVSITDNLLDSVNVGVFTGDANLTIASWGDSLTVQSPKYAIQDLTYARNTFGGTGAINAAMILEGKPAVNRLTTTTTIFSRGSYGVYVGGVGEGTAALNFSAVPYEFLSNVIVGTTANPYPASTVFAASIAAAQALGIAGVDTASLAARLAGVVVAP